MNPQTFLFWLLTSNEKIQSERTSFLFALNEVLTFQNGNLLSASNTHQITNTFFPHPLQKGHVHNETPFDPLWQQREKNNDKRIIKTKGQQVFYARSQRKGRAAWPLYRLAMVSCSADTTMTFLWLSRPTLAGGRGVLVQRGVSLCVVLHDKDNNGDDMYMTRGRPLPPQCLVCLSVQLLEAQMFWTNCQFRIYFHVWRPTLD